MFGWIKFTYKYIVILITISLSGCMVGPNFHAPKFSKNKKYTATPLPQKTNGKIQKLVFGKEVPANWWQAFHNKNLNQLIKTAFANNPDLDAATAAIIQAQETLNTQVGSTLYPEFKADLGGKRQAFSSNSSGSFAGGNIFNLYNATISVSYALDLFGGARRQLESLRAKIDYEKYLKDATKLTLAGNIATTTITIASLKDQIKATAKIIKSEEELLKIIKRQYHYGAASQPDILLQKTQLATTKATLPSLQLSLKKNTHALAVLLGQAPTQTSTPQITLNQLSLPTHIPVRIPSSLLQNRPDIQEARATLHAANAEIGVATANLFPQFNITGDIERNANIPSLLSHPNSSAWQLAGNLVQPIFNGGSLRASRRKAIAARNEAASKYKKVILLAYQNVADSLRAIQFDADSATAEAAATEASLQSLQIIKHQYHVGATSYINVLTAEESYNQTKLREILAKAQRLTDTVALFVALGGSEKRQYSLPPTKI